NALIVSMLWEFINDQKKVTGLFENLDERIFEKAEKNNDWVFVVISTESELFDERQRVVLNFLAEMVFFACKNLNNNMNNMLAFNDTEMNILLKAIIKDMFLVCVESMYEQISKIPENQIADFKTIVLLLDK